MNGKTEALHSVYVIDGIQKEYTPAQLLDTVSAGTGSEGRGCTIVDETLDPVFKGYDFDPQQIDSYLNSVLRNRLQLPLWMAGQHTRKMIAISLLDTLWRNGRFVLPDLQVDAHWKWNVDGVGSRAAFYESVEAAAEYVDSLGLSIAGYSYEQDSAWDCSVSFTPHVGAAAPDEGYAIFNEPFRSADPVMSSGRVCPGVLVPDPQSWLVYIPFDPCDFRLGGSVLAQSLGLGGGVPTQISDADYFMDCYEVVRELAEDGILIAAATVGEGGLLKAVKGMTSQGTGIQVDISDIMRAYAEKNQVRVLFGEVPGALIQIKNADFDYLDAELLLQDVAFFPLGHPAPGNDDVRVRSSAKTGIQTILESLMQKAEGED